MTTWTSSQAALAGVALALAGCDAVPGLSTETPGNDALESAVLASGDVTLTPPAGYCVDARTLKARFALMARCDALSAGAGTAGAAIGVITVSLAPRKEDTVLPTAEELATAARATNPRDVTRTDSSVTFRAEGAAPLPRMSATHWRGMATLDDYVMAVAVYGPDKGRVVTGEGRDMLNQVFAQAASPTPDAEG